MAQSKNWLLISINVTWLLFTLIVLFVESVWSGLPNVLRSVVGIAGLIVAVLCFFAIRAWITASLSIASALLLVYVVDWASRIAEYVDADPNAGALGAIGIVWTTPFRVAAKMLNEGSLLSASIELYWTVGMPMLQFVLGFLLINRLRAGRAMSSLSV